MFVNRICERLNADGEIDIEIRRSFELESDKPHGAELRRGFWCFFVLTWRLAWCFVAFFFFVTFTRGLFHQYFILLCRARWLFKALWIHVREIDVLIAFKIADEDANLRLDETAPFEVIVGRC